MSHPADRASIVFIAPRLRDLPGFLRRAFEHPWVASYQVGFGPPLVRSSERLIKRTKGVRAALDKLDVYLDVCFLDERERARLASLHRRLLVRAHGPVEAELVDRAAGEVLDLSLRLHAPLAAPDQVRSAMMRAGVQPGWSTPPLPPDEQAGRFYVHLGDARGERLLFDDRVRHNGEDPERALGVELRVPVGLRDLWRTWAAALARESGYRMIDIGEPISHAKAQRDGVSS